jgi:hypothetical protein
MLEIIIAILLSIGVQTKEQNISIQSDTIGTNGIETVIFTDNSSGDSYIMTGTEQNGWGIQSTGGGAASNNGTPATQ